MGVWEEATVSGTYLFSVWGSVQGTLQTEHQQACMCVGCVCVPACVCLCVKGGTRKSARVYKSQGQNSAMGIL